MSEYLRTLLERVCDSVVHDKDLRPVAKAALAEAYDAGYHAGSAVTKTAVASSPLVMPAEATERGRSWWLQDEGKT